MENPQILSSKKILESRMMPIALALHKDPKTERLDSENGLINAANCKFSYCR